LGLRTAEQSEFHARAPFRTSYGTLPALPSPAAPRGGGLRSPILVNWMTELPSILIHGFALSATCGSRLLVIAPTALGFLGFAMFAMGIAVHGF
jgi:hypothetical protein